MTTTLLIPARYASTRYPGKPLALLRQTDGSKKSLIQMTWEAAQSVADVDEVYVVTDDIRISDAAQAFGASVLMTSPEAENGTARCAEAVAKGLIESDLIINLQGDAPLTPPWFLDALITAMTADPTIGMATPVLRCDAETYRLFTEDRRAGRVGGTTAVFDNNRRALYFSKEVLPYIAPDTVFADSPPVFHHVGVYAYRPDALAKYATWTPGPLERHEGLEQLRFLEQGQPVTCVEVDAKGRIFWELNNPEDVSRIESVLERQI